MADKFRVLFVCSHPVQYQSPIFRQMAQHRRLDVHVAYCSLQGAEPMLDPEFGIELSWDVPLLDGYAWTHVPNRSRRPNSQGFFGLINPGLWKLISSGGYDAVVVLTGYVYASFWIALLAAKLHRRAVLFGTDAHALTARDGKRFKARIKRWVWPRLFGLADVVIVPSTLGTEMMRSLGISEERLALTPYAVDNGWWIEQSQAIDRDSVRRAWGVPQSAPVVLFCAKLQPWKRPQDLLHAFAKANVLHSHLVFAGEGPTRAELETQAATLGLAERVHFLGFKNQSQLPAIYCASDLLVLPSDYEPFGVVVNEAMLCGCAAVVSDRVGAGRDLVATEETGFIFPCGDRNALAAILRDVLGDPIRLRRMGEQARRRMETWSPVENIQGLLGALDQSQMLAAR
jgi:glycosyltransferase involved in cell wall biosynthesis